MGFLVSHLMFMDSRHLYTMIHYVVDADAPSVPGYMGDVMYGPLPLSELWKQVPVHLHVLHSPSSSPALSSHFFSPPPKPRSPDSVHLDSILQRPQTHDARGAWACNICRGSAAGCAARG